MICKTGIILKPPSLYIEETCNLNNPEINSLINSITEYFSQTNIVYDAELTVSNNEWEDIPGVPGARRRKDISFPLNELVEIHLKKDGITFKLNDLQETEHSLNVGENFFYFMDYERAFYD